MLSHGNSGLKQGLSLALLAVLLATAGVAHGASQFTLAGGVKPTTGIAVDDDLDVLVNGVSIYSDGSAGSGTRPPISFMGNVGDTVHVVVRDTFGTCSKLSPIYLFNATFQAVLAAPGFDRGCLLPPVDQGVSYDVSFVVPDFSCRHGEILVSAGYGIVLKVNPVTGKRALFSDFTNALQGATGFPGRIAAGDCDAVYATDQASDQAAKLFKVLPDGTRILLSDAKNVAQGPAWYTTFGLGIDLDGSILVTDRGQGGGGNFAGLWSVDATTGFRTQIIDSGSLNGGHSAPESVVVDAGGNIFMGDAEGPTWLGGAGTYCYEYGDCGALFAVNRTTHALTVLTDFGNPAQGPRGNDGGYSLALDNDGTFLMVDPYYSINNVDVGALFRVDPAGVPAGARSVLTTQLTHFSTVALGTDGSILLGDCNTPTSGGLGGGICTVDRVTGVQAVLSDLGDPLQGPTGLPLSIAVLRGGNIIFGSGFEPPPPP
ncbi:MAG TPA: hypothetical protein VFI49_04195 [Rudaea sp.]|nr:hypothetical protein [Rudaea sp.]